MRLVKALSAIVAVCAVVVVAAFVGEDYLGDRVFVRNGSQCDIVLTEEHSGKTVHPGERTLAKSGLIEHSPSMMLVSKQQVWAGVHFRVASVDTRTREGARVVASFPAEWWKPTLMGRELTLEVNRTGDLVLHAPASANSSSPQPEGFPLPGLPATIPLQEDLACL